MSLFFRIIFIQVLIWVCFYIALHTLTLIQVNRGMTPNNQWLMNIHMVTETVLLYTAVFFIKRDFILHLSVGISLVIFIAVVSLQFINNGIEMYMHHADITECITITILFIQLIFFYFNKTKWSRSPELIISLGLLLYFGGSVPYISMMHYLQEVNPQLNHLLFDFISNVLANVRYILTGFSFWLIYRNAQHVKQNG